MNILRFFIVHLTLAFGLLTLNPQILNADPLDHWHFRDSLTNTGINSVAYGNGLFVAVSGDYPDTPAILTSPDGAVWTKKDFPAVIFYGVGYGNGIFVAVGEDANLYTVKKYIYTSSDGVTWEERYSESGYGLNAVGYGNGIFVAIGWDALVTSIDGGMSWNKTGIPTTGRGVAYGDGLFVAVGHWNTILTSPDGIDWTLQSVRSPGGFIHLEGVAYGSGTFVAVGSDSANFPHGIILTSHDGVHWKIKSFRGNFIFYGVAYENDTFVAVGSGGALYTSTDGVTWKERNSNTLGSLGSVAYGNYTFVIGGGGGLILQSDPTGPEIISTPSVLNGTINGFEKESYSYSTGGSSSNLDHSVRYLFDWGDGTDSGWLPVGETNASKSWASGGTYLVKVQARCSIHTSVVSSSSDVLTVNIEPPTITLQSPLNAEIFNSCSLTTGHRPTFTWMPNGTFSKVTILFSPSLAGFTAPIVKASIQATQNNWIPSIGAWKKIMMSSNNNGSIQNVYWKVVGTMKDNTLLESGVMNISIHDPVPPGIQSPGDGDKLPFGTPPTFTIDANCNIKFELDISSIGDFSDPDKIKKFTFTIRDPNLTPTVQKTLSSGQWKAVSTLIGTATGYFRVRAWDGIKRETVSEIRSFTIQ